MRAHLARHARRVLIQNSRSPSCALYSAPTRRRQLLAPISQTVCRRTFFDKLFPKAPREVRQPEIEPGWMKIMLWRSRMLDKLRPPPREELIRAWRVFFESKTQTRAPLNSSQALQCRRLLAYLLQPTEERSGTAANLSYTELHTTFLTLQNLRLRERTKNHANLVTALYNALVSSNDKNHLTLTTWAQYIEILSSYGGSKEALEHIYKNWDDLLVHLKGGNNLVVSVADGLVADGHEEELVQLVNFAEQHGVPYDEHIQASVLTFFAKQNRVPETQHWFSKKSTGDVLGSTYVLIAIFAARNDLREWAIPFFLRLAQSNPTKTHWDTLLQGILILGKGLNEVEKMLPQMVHNGQPVIADSATFNNLLRAAVELKDSLLAEDILSLATDNGVKLSGETYLVLMRLRLQAGYLPGVQAAYKKVKDGEPWQSKPALWWEFSQLLNDYLSALCASNEQHRTLIGELVEAAEEGQINVDPKTLAALCVKYLRNDQRFDLMDALSIHAFQYSAPERDIIQDVLTKYCLSPHTTTARAWACYEVLRQFFQDLSFSHRVELMENFFKRKRSDMASHVFGHMRQHRNQDYHPLLETYISCFEGFSKHPDEQAVEMVFNMLKMDMTVEPNTQLYTAMILAHAACGKSSQAMDFWHEIENSKEGPTYASLEAIFWALERKPAGAHFARRLWKKIEAMELEITPGVYNAYLGALAGTGEEEEVRDLILRMEAMVGVEADATTLGVTYNAFPGQQWQEDFETWAKLRYPAAWATLETKGRRMTEESLCKFKLNRVFKT
ncbi:hypothetical protein G7046_g9973 [Stylonectria norvegica]|nr:hypothetical protein G7046_g9973 [Stylonectria norvegica]